MIWCSPEETAGITAATEVHGRVVRHAVKRAGVQAITPHDLQYGVEPRGLTPG